MLARRMSCAFEATPTKRLVRTPELAGREAGSLPHQDGGTSGTPGMYLVQDSMGQQWACSAERFRTTYSTCGNTEWLLQVLSGSPLPGARLAVVRICAETGSWSVLT